MPDEIKRSAFDRMSPAERMAAVRQGMRIVDDPPPPPAKLRPGEVSRAGFDKMGLAERLAVIRAGTPIRDIDE